MTYYDTNSYDGYAFVYPSKTGYRKNDKLSNHSIYEQILALVYSPEDIVEQEEPFVV